MTGSPKASKSPPARRRHGCRRIVLLALVVLIAWPVRWPLFNAGRAVRLAFDPAPIVLPIPVEDVKPKDLEDTWGAARSEGRRHEGIDIFAPRGNHVTAAARGFVTGRGWNRLGGRFVQVFGAGALSYYYAHLDAFDEPKVGDWVEVGDLLGYVGTSGNANGTPPHLHFGVYRIGSRAINPYPLLVPNPPHPLGPPLPSALPPSREGEERHLGWGRPSPGRWECGWERGRG